MQAVTINDNQAGQRLDKFLHKYLPLAGNGFLYKMLRKKNIVLNGKRAEGKEMLAKGDLIQFYFSEETFQKFAGRPLEDTAEYEKAFSKWRGEEAPTVIYEDSDLLFLNKPAGLLTQKAKPEDISVNEWMIGYLLHCNAVTAENLHTFHPSVCNRLDRNTSGLVLCGKSLQGSQLLSRMIKERSIRKFYLTICKGVLSKPRMLEGYLVKDTKTNKVTVCAQNSHKAAAVKTFYRPLAVSGDNAYTLLEVELITGKTHQIRAHLATDGHPLVGDCKYGDASANHLFQKKYNLHAQLLHAHRVVLPDKREYIAPVSQQFLAVMDGLGIKSGKEVL